MGRETAGRAAAHDIAIRAPVTDAYAEILTPGALDLLARLHTRFEGPRRDLLQGRSLVHQALDQWGWPAFRERGAIPDPGPWTARPAPDGLSDRRVVISSGVEGRGLIAALNSGACECVADFANSTSPTWSNLIEGQHHLREAVSGTLSYTSAGGLWSRVNRDAARLSVRPRGWPLDERRLMIRHRPVSAGLFDLGLYLFHNAVPLAQRNGTPQIELPEVRTRQEARWWSDVLAFVEDHLALPRGTVRVTLLVDHVLAAFELDQILWELRDHGAGLAWSRTDYLHSFIRTFSHRPELTLPERQQLTVARHFLRSAAETVVRTAHRRDTHALIGIESQLPIKEHSAANRRVMRRLRADLAWLVDAGFDGVYVAHAELVPLAREVFDLRLVGPHQARRQREDALTRAEDLLAVPACVITRPGLRHTVAVALEYLEAWLRGVGRTAVDYRLEDAASAELAAAQIWQWIKHGARLDDGRPITPGLLDELLAGELARRSDKDGSAQFEASRFLCAADLLAELVRADELADGLCAAARPYLR